MLPHAVAVGSSLVAFSLAPGLPMNITAGGCCAMEVTGD
jgi:hypothetical protein